MFGKRDEIDFGCTNVNYRFFWGKLSHYCLGAWQLNSSFRKAIYFNLSFTFIDTNDVNCFFHCQESSVKWVYK